MGVFVLLSAAFSTIHGITEVQKIRGTAVGGWRGSVLASWWGIIFYLAAFMTAMLQVGCAHAFR
jgi:hypothetical protein